MTTQLSPLANAVLLPRRLIRPNPDQPRQFFNESDMADLRASIEEYGVRTPVKVRYEPSRFDGTPYLLIDGGRRFFASEGVRDELPALIENVSDATARELALVDNLHRSPLAPIEEARAIADLMTRDGLTIQSLARRLSKSDGWVNNRLALLKTAPDVQQVAALVPGAMSSLLLIDSVKEPDTRADLLEQVQRDAPFKTIQAQIETHRHAQEQHACAASFSAPDTHTSERQNAHARGESSSMSRGKRVTGPKRAEVVAEVERAWKTLEAFAPLLNDSDYETHILKRARPFVRGDFAKGR